MGVAIGIITLHVGFGAGKFLGGRADGADGAGELTLHVGFWGLVLRGILMPPPRRPFTVHVPPPSRHKKTPLGANLAGLST